MTTAASPDVQQLPSSTAVFDADAQHIFKKQYAVEGEQFPQQGFLRTARFISQGRQGWMEKYYALMAEKRFCPGGRVLAGSGTQHSNVMNCFVQGNTQEEPSTLEGIMEIAMKLALVTKVGGGNGLNLDVYPAKVDTRKHTRGVAYLSASHPDVMDFVTERMRPPTRPDDAKVTIRLKNWDRMVYGEHISEDLLAACAAHGVTTVAALPANTVQVGDSMEAIMTAAAGVVRSSIVEADIRIDLSPMRPEGAPIQGSGGTSSGPVSFLFEVFDNFMTFANLGAATAGPVAILRHVYAPVLRVVRQGGSRRGAGMATISVDHPDVLDFLTAKDSDREETEGDISTFNMSILITDAFYNAVKTNKRWNFNGHGVHGKYLPVFSQDGPQTQVPQEPGLVYVPLSLHQGKLTIPAAWLWNEIATHAHGTGEPGLIFIDRVNEHSAVKNLGARHQIRSTNPCLKGDTLILTRVDTNEAAELRSVRIDTLAEDGRPVWIWTGSRWQLTQFRVTGTDQPVFTVAFENGEEVTATAAHHFILDNGARVELQTLKVGDRLQPATDAAEARALIGTPEEGNAAFDHLYRFMQTAPGEFVVRSIKPAGTEAKVYCCSVSGEHTFALANNLLSGNCGEIPLTTGEPCDLGAINLGQYALSGQFDHQAFNSDVRTCVRLLDDLLDVNVFALEDNRAASQAMRRIGLGVMGLADMLIRVGLPYNTPAARDLVFQVMNEMRETAIDESEQIALERGPYPLYTEHADKIPHPPRRNVAVLTVAPTGTTALLMGASSGLEPLFSPFIFRKIGSEYREILHPLFVEILSQHPATPNLRTPDGDWNWETITQEIGKHQGSVQALTDLPELVRELFVCAHDIIPADHVAMQGTVQRAFDNGGYGGNSLSKTINLLNSATTEDVKEAYSQAYELGCKGITVYRDGSRSFQPLNTSKEAAEQNKAAEQTAGGEAKPVHVSAGAPVPQMTIQHDAPPPVAGSVAPAFKRRPVLSGMTLQIKLNHMETGLSTSYLVTVNQDPETRLPIEVIVVGGNSGQEAHADAEALGRLTSNALQFGTPAGKVINTLKGIEGGLMAYVTQPNGKTRRITSKADLIAYAVSLAMEDTQSTPDVPTEHERFPLETYEAAFAAGLPNEGNEPTMIGSTGASECPVCHEVALIASEGCYTCHACTYSRCS